MIITSLSLNIIEGVLQSPLNLLSYLKIYRMLYKINGIFSQYQILKCIPKKAKFVSLLTIAKRSYVQI